MDKIFKPERITKDLNSPVAVKEWTFLDRTFNMYLDSIQELAPDKLNILLSHVDHNMYDYIENCFHLTYEEAIKTLKNIYIKPTNEIFTYKLQKSRESLKFYSHNMNYQKL